MGWKNVNHLMKAVFAMLYRKAMKDLETWRQEKTHQALLVTGARQVGKTTLVREFARQSYESLVEINFVETPSAVQTLSAAVNQKDLLLRISVLTGVEVVPGKMLLFLDEVQECRDMLTWVKFLSGDGNLDVILSGSLLGIDAFVNVRSFPVGFLNVLEMFPLTFEEFCRANGIGEEAWRMAVECVESCAEVPDFLHDTLSRRFREYLLVGGMPDAVQAYVGTGQLPAARRVHEGIVDTYKADIMKYVEDATEARQIKMVYEAIPSQLNAPTKRFKYARLEKNLRFANLETAFDWLTNAGIAIEATRVGEARYPLTLSEDRASFKFFMNDIGLMTSQIMGDVSLEVLDGIEDINYGSLYEAFVAQELLASGLKPHYYSSKKRGEVDFVVEDKRKGKTKLIEVKSGKSYKRHSALSSLLEAGEAVNPVVLYGGNCEQAEDRRYVPVYAAGLMGKMF